MGVDKEVDTEVKKTDEVEKSKTNGGKGGWEVLRSKTRCFAKISPRFHSIEGPIRLPPCV